MKNRRNVIVAFLLVAVLLLGVGYATLTDTLTIIGNATIDKNAANDKFDENIYFIDSKFVNTTGTGKKGEDVASHTEKGDDATFAAHSLAYVGEAATFKFTVMNDSNVDVKVLVNSKKTSGVENPSNSNPSKFTTNYDYSRTDMIIPAGETMDITVTVTVAAPVIDADTATFGLEMIVSTDTNANPS